MSAQAVVQQPAVHKQNVRLCLRNPECYRSFGVLSYLSLLAQYLDATLTVMKILVFYRQNSDYTRQVEDYLRDLSRLHDIHEQDIKVVDPDTRSGAEDASIYDILAYPGIVVTDGYGKFVHSWSGELPLMDELMSYAFNLQ